MLRGIKDRAERTAKRRTRLASDGCMTEWSEAGVALYWLPIKPAP
jgi:hypothetical protein